MKTFLVLASFVLFAAVPSQAAQHAVAPQGAEAASVPVVDSFADGDQRLQLVALPAPDAASMQVTLIYEDAAQQTLRSVTIDPTLVATTNAATYTQFLDQMDSDFVSFVRASLADRLMHLRTPQSRFDRAESTLFFGTKGNGANVARVGAEEAGRAE